MSNQKYKLRYSWDAEKGNFTKDDIKTDHDGLCDAMLVISIIRPDDGSHSQLMMSADGETGAELTQEEIFKVWLLMGLNLSDNNGLTGWLKGTVDIYANRVRAFFEKMRQHGYGKEI